MAMLGGRWPISGLIDYTSYIHVLVRSSTVTEMASIW